MANTTTQEHVGQFGIYRDDAPVRVAVIKHIATDLRDWRLRLRWTRLTRRWIRRNRNAAQ